MLKFPILIIDDERSARQELKRAVAFYPELELVGEAANADDAEELIRTLKPALIFLDIQMP
ncbi:MAG: response regulator, partial [Chryseobacterium sp.]